MFDESFRKPLARVAFLEQILPGLAGGLAASITFYPLELYETTVQAGAKPSRDTGRAQTARRSRATLNFEKRRSKFLFHQSHARPKNVPVTFQPDDVAAGFRGVDMAVGSALFGFGAFFSTFAAVDAIAPGSSVEALLAKNVIAAFASQVVNSPFQLLKTSVVLSNKSAKHAFLHVTRGGKELLRLWTGVQANLLGVTLVACQFTFFRMLVNQYASGGTGPLEAGIIGAVASLGACVLTYPSVALKTKVMAEENAESGGKAGSENEAGSDECCILRAAREMWTSRSLYAGITPFLLRSVPPTGMLFAIQRFFETSYQLPQ